MLQWYKRGAAYEEVLWFDVGIKRYTTEAKAFIGQKSCGLM